jgi:FSR family fosmidomycin resistance protein-like MFS transporter
MAAIGMSFIGLLPSYASLIPFLVFGGLGVSCFHPQAAVLAGYFSGPRKGLGEIALHGRREVGYGLGPMITLAIIIGLDLLRRTM